MAIQDGFIFATSGLHIVCIASSTGEIRWDVPLEESADAVVTTKECVLATSSVYDIEHNDFIESAIWSISFDGDVLATHRIASVRGHSIPTRTEQLRVSRPMNGYLILDTHGGVIEQIKEWKARLSVRQGVKTRYLGSLTAPFVHWMFVTIHGICDQLRQ